MNAAALEFVIAARAITITRWCMACGRETRHVFAYRTFDGYDLFSCCAPGCGRWIKVKPKGATE